MAYDNEAGASAGRWARELRDGARRGVWRRVASWLGVSAHTRRADAQAACAEAGRAGERATAALLAGLEPCGWTFLHDRAIPGADRANADHIGISPAARVYVIDSKMLSAKTGPVDLQAGRLMYGPYERARWLRSLEFERVLVERALRTPVTALMAVHGAPVAGDGFQVAGVSVIPARRLVGLLALNDGPVNPGALWLVQTARAVLPSYR